MFSNIKNQVINRKGILNKPIVNYSPEEANNILNRVLSSPKPIMIARFGAFELGMTLSVRTPFNLKNVFRFVTGDIANLGYDRKLARSFCYNAGFFPNDRKLIEKYAELLVNDMKDCDILGSWLPAEKQFSKELKHCVKISLKDLEPFYYSNPWTLQLANKKVLVIHPFRDSIMHQWKKRELLFGGNIIMPECDLQVMKSIQTLAGNKVEFKTWFEALQYMEEEIGKRDFDIALLGCGAYGFNLAAYIKRMGKQAVHLGGFLQILFGVMGKRWEGKYSFVNEQWIRPLNNDYPSGASSIENGCYW